MLQNFLSFILENWLVLLNAFIGTYIVIVTTFLNFKTANGALKPIGKIAIVLVVAAFFLNFFILKDEQKKNKETLDFIKRESLRLHPNDFQLSLFIPDTMDNNKALLDDLEYVVTNGALYNTHMSDTVWFRAKCVKYMDKIEEKYSVPITTYKFISESFLFLDLQKIGYYEKLKDGKLELDLSQYSREVGEKNHIIYDLYIKGDHYQGKATNTVKAIIKL